MRDDPRYAEGVRLFQQGRYFETHEVLELAWRACPAGSDKQFLQGLIQLAVSLEHWRRGNPRGARGQWDKARAKLEPLPGAYGGLRLGALLRAFEAWYRLRGIDAAVIEQAEGRYVAAVEGGAWPAPEWDADAPEP